MDPLSDIAGPLVWIALAILMGIGLISFVRALRARGNQRPAQLAQGHDYRFFQWNHSQASSDPGFSGFGGGDSGGGDCGGGGGE
ncbi:MAG: hypothetical protein ABI811_05765 [Acidobacteriota bacterium]